MTEIVTRAMSLDELGLSRGIRLGAPDPNAALLGHFKWHRVVDGDTLHGEVFFDLPVVHYQLRDTKAYLRLFGADSPEMRAASDSEREDAMAARAYTLQWMQDHTPHCANSGEFIAILRAIDDFGRFVAEVRCDQTHDLATDLIAAGHAKPYHVV